MARTVACLPAAAAAILAFGVCPARGEPASKGVGIDEAVGAVEPSIKPPNRWALVIGVADYADQRIPDLPACGRDAADLAATLTDPNAGLFPKGNVTLLLNEAVTRAAVVSALDVLARRAGKDDLVVVFFSGHGATDEKGRAYWVMSDTRVDQLRATALPEVEITELLGEIRTRRLVTVIDACYSAATASVGATKSLVDVSKVYPQFQGDGRVGITASKGDQLSMVITDEQDPGFGHSAFAYHVIEGLRGRADAGGNRDGIIEVDELWNYVKDRTADTSRRQGGNQEPQLKGQIGSRFLLAIDADRLLAIAREKQAGEVATQERIARLKELFGGDQITAEQLAEGRRLLGTPAEQLAPGENPRRDAYIECAEGRLAPQYLAAVLTRAGNGARETGEGPTSSPAKPATAVTWVTTLAQTTARFSDLDAPLAVVIDLKGSAADPRLAGLADRALAWLGAPATSQAGARPRTVALVIRDDAKGGAQVQGGLLAYPQPISIQSLGTNGLVDEPGGQRLVTAGRVSGLVSPSCVLVLPGTTEDFSRFMERGATGTRPAWTGALSFVAQQPGAVAAVTDGVWLREHLRALGGAEPGKLFIGSVLGSLMLQGDPEIERTWALSMSDLAAATVVGQGNGDWLRCTIRLDFLRESDAVGAAPGWSNFGPNLQERFGDTAVRALDVQQSGASVVVRIEFELASIVRWIDESGVIPGGAGKKKE